MSALANFDSKTNSIGNDTLYRVILKLFTTHNDTLDVLKLPSLRGLEPMTIYNQEKNRGFTARLTMEQICEIYYLPIVSLTSNEYDS
jgi:hypothetical protein